jgi:hypothetical protein
MDKEAFDRCGNCTRGFGFLSRKAFLSLVSLTDCRNTVQTVDLCTVLIVVPKSSNWSNFRDTIVVMLKSVIIARSFLKVRILLMVLIVVDRMPSQVLVTMSVRSLREYIEAYGLAKGMPFVEKTDLINTILDTEITEHNEEVELPRSRADVDISTDYTWISGLVQETSTRNPQEV